MSKELEFLKDDYQKVKNEVDANNKILEELLQNPLVQMYRDTYIANEQKKKELETLGISLAYKEMVECEHAFVRTEIQKERDYDRILRQPIYCCLKCGLTNGYAVKEVNPVLLNQTEKDMSYIFDKTAKNGIILHERRTLPLEVAKEIYIEIQKRTKNLTISKEQLKMYFTIALSKNDPTYYQDLIYYIKKLAGFEIKNDSKIEQRIELRLRDIEEIENGITCYKISDFSKDLFEFVRTIQKIAGVEFTSLEDISKYPKIVNEELEKLIEKEKNVNFDVMAVPNPKAYVIARDKWQEFVNTKPNPEIRKRNEEISNKFRVNNLAQTEEPKKKTKIKN